MDHSDLPHVGMGIPGVQGAAVVGQWERDGVVTGPVWAQDLGVSLFFLDFVSTAKLGAPLPWPVWLGLVPTLLPSGIEWSANWLKSGNSFTSL